MSDELSDHDIMELRAMHREASPDDFGDACPVCGDPFDAGAPGFAPEEAQLDCLSLVRLCFGPPPEWVLQTLDHESWDRVDQDTDLPYLYPHYDEHIDVIADD